MLYIITVNLLKFTRRIIEERREILKKFIEPKIEIIDFGVEDIITSSSPFFGDFDDVGGGSSGGSNDTPQVPVD